MAAVLAAAGFLEGLARGTAALPATSPAIQGLCQLLKAASVASQAEVTSVAEAEPSSSAMPREQFDCMHWRNAAALACCSTWQVSILLPCYDVLHTADHGSLIFQDVTSCGFIVCC